MNKSRIIASFIIVFIVSGLIGFLLYTEKILIRLPVIVQKKPKITFIVGNAFYRDCRGGGWYPIIVGTELEENFEVRTEKKSTIDLLFHDSMALRIPQNSKLKIDYLSVKKLNLNLKKGALYGKFEKIYKNHKINVLTPTTVAAIRGTELGFEVTEIRTEKPVIVPSDGDEKSEEDDATAAQPSEEIKYQTTVYAISGITEVHNPEFSDRKILLSYQQKLIVDQNEPVGSSIPLTENETTNLRAVLNSIHTEEVLLISDKIHFKTGSARILKRSYTELNKIVLLLSKKNITVRIEGHTDNKGGASFNQTLSVKRAKAIRGYFVKKGIQKDRMLVTGYGESRFVANNKTSRGRALNRRVEFIIVK